MKERLTPNFKNSAIVDGLKDMTSAQPKFKDAVYALGKQGNNWMDKLAMNLTKDKSAAYALSKDAIKEFGEDITLKDFVSVAQRHGIEESMLSKMFHNVPLKAIGRVAGPAGFLASMVMDADAAGIPDLEEKQLVARNKLFKGNK